MRRQRQPGGLRIAESRSVAVLVQPPAPIAIEQTANGRVRKTILLRPATAHTQPRPCLRRTCEGQVVGQRTGGEGCPCSPDQALEAGCRPRGRKGHRYYSEAQVSPASSG